MHYDDGAENPRVEELLRDFESKHSADGKPKRKALAQAYLRQDGERKWLCQKGKGYIIDFNQQERSKMKEFFQTLDKKRQGQVGLDELEEMLLSLGLAHTIEEVKSLMGTVDEDHSGSIEFEEFLRMIQDDNKQNANVVSFFKQLALLKIEAPRGKVGGLRQTDNDQNGGYAKQQLSSCPKNIPFEMIASQIRRNHILASLNIGRCKSPDDTQSEKVKKGKKVVTALQKMEERRIIRNLRSSESN